MRRQQLRGNALIWALIGFGVGTMLMLWIFTAS